MTAKEKNFSLDESAQQLYKEFQGIDDTVRADVSLLLESELMEFLKQEEKKLDHLRLLLAKAVCTLMDFLQGSRLTVSDPNQNQNVRAFLSILKKIAETTKSDNKLSCRFRGQQHVGENDTTAQNDSEIYDYELSLNNVILDFNMATIVEEREKENAKSLSSNLMKAFHTMSVLNIFNFSIDLGLGDETILANIALTLKHLARYFHPGIDQTKYVVSDEYGYPSINLTLLAGTNQVRPDSLQALVEQIKPKIVGPEPATELSRFTTVYDVIIATDRFKKKLPRMPIEVNSVHQLMLHNRPDPKMTAEAVQVSRLVLSKYGNNPRMATEMISSIQEEGYRKIQTDIMGKRLTLATEFLHHADGRENKTILHNEALRNIEDGLDQIPDTIYDNISVHGNEVSALNHQGQKTMWSLHDKILSLLSFFKQRSTTNKKIQDIANKDVVFEQEDYEVIAKNFNISLYDASRLVSLLRDCFEDDGRFRRASFEKNVPEFVQYEGRVFAFLWHYLKELETRKDRVTFLNSIQILIAKLNRPQDVCAILLKDIFNSSAEVSYSDRNGLILGTILLRKYNKEGESNIELTPEEVLLVQDGLNQDMAKMATDYIEKNRELVIQKFRSITEKLFDSSAQKTLAKDQMPSRFLLYLLREMIIYFSLIGGSMAQSIIKRVIQEFGNPQSSYYKKMKNKSELRYALQLLQAACRGIRRFDDSRSSALFDEIKSNQNNFVKLNGIRSHRIAVERLIERIYQPLG
ncbi:MAG: hypothetical protein KJ950_09955 [Proteobacteria bacterium]|nr:hypothetical protein [Pseudomonadota bacterium]MBU1688979.1 hypothetical protein [Pseudomonadota bacterium]